MCWAGRARSSVSGQAAGTHQPSRRGPGPQGDASRLRPALPPCPPREHLGSQETQGHCHAVSLCSAPRAARTPPRDGVLAAASRGAARSAHCAGPSVPGVPGGRRPAVRPPPRGCSERVPRGARPRPPAPPDVQCGFFTWPCVLPVNASGWLRSHACERERSGTSRPDGTCGHGPSTSPFHGPWRQRAAGAWLCSPMTGVAGGVVTAALST